MSATKIIVGMDEVGRGALAGPAVVAVVSLDGLDREKFAQKLREVLRREITDSKKLTRLQRERAAVFLKEKVIWEIGECEAGEIDRIGIVPSLTTAAGRAIAGLENRGFTISQVLADASLHHPFEGEISTEHFVKGDERILEISCASIIAKVYRDGLMRDLAERIPGYSWQANVGYGSAQHLLAIRALGKTEQHRNSFLKGL